MRYKDNKIVGIYKIFLGNKKPPLDEVGRLKSII